MTLLRCSMFIKHYNKIFNEHFSLKLTYIMNLQIKFKLTAV